ncbi:Uncharacterised protein [Mycobacteroides abscessus subsp. massiliense]|nr:Uncharacterised protein [Mycobacteroides abscessus subsp. massiliense]
MFFYRSRGFSRCFPNGFLKLLDSFANCFNNFFFDRFGLFCCFLSSLGYFRRHLGNGFLNLCNSLTDGFNDRFFCRFNVFFYFLNCFRRHFG